MMSRLSPETASGRKFVVSLNMYHYGSCRDKNCTSCLPAPLCICLTLHHFLLETSLRILHIRSHMREICIGFLVSEWPLSTPAQALASLSLSFLNYELWSHSRDDHEHKDITLIFILFM